MADLIDFWSLLLFLPFLFAIPKTKWHRRPDPLFEYYNTNDDNNAGVYGNYWRAQTFTVGATGHTVTSIKVKLYRVGSPQTGTISIRATDANGHPTGGDLTSASIDGNSLSTTPTWYEYPVSSYSLSANTKYAIVLRFPSGNASNMAEWRADSTSPTYTGGNFEDSTDGGSSWYAMTSWDFMFEIWGNPPSGSASYGKYFPNGMRGQLDTINLYIRNTAGSAQNLVLGFSLSPISGELFQITNSIPAGFSGWWTVTVARFWDYDSLFIYTKSTTGANIGLGMDTEATLGDCFSLVSGSWQWLPYRPWIRVNLKAQAHYPIAVEGKVSVKDIDEELQYLDSGDSFYASCYALAVANGASCYPCRIKNPSGSGKTLVLIGMVFYASVISGYLDISNWADSTYTADGTSVTPATQHIASGKTSAMNVYRSPTVNTLGTDVFSDFLGYNLFGLLRYRLEIDAGHDLVVKVINKTGAQADIGVKPIWYEKPL